MDSLCVDVEGTVESGRYPIIERRNRCMLLTGTEKLINQWNNIDIEKKNLLFRNLATLQHPCDPLSNVRAFTMCQTAAGHATSRFYNQGEFIEKVGRVKGAH